MRIGYARALSDSGDQALPLDAIRSIPQNNAHRGVVLLIDTYDVAAAVETVIEIAPALAARRNCLFTITISPG